MNKSSWERGFAHGSVYKTEIVDLSEKVKGEEGVVFGIKPGDPKVSDMLDADGLPPIGSKLNYGDPFYSYVNLNTGQSHVTFYKYVIIIIFCDVKSIYMVSHVIFFFYSLLKVKLFFSVAIMCDLRKKI